MLIRQTALAMTSAHIRAAHSPTVVDSLPFCRPELSTPATPCHRRLVRLSGCRWVFCDLAGCRTDSLAAACGLESSRLNLFALHPFTALLALHVCPLRSHKLLLHLPATAVPTSTRGRRESKQHWPRAGFRVAFTAPWKDYLHAHHWKRATLSFGRPLKLCKTSSRPALLTARIVISQHPRPDPACFSGIYCTAQISFGLSAHQPQPSNLVSASISGCLLFHAACPTSSAQPCRIAHTSYTGNVNRQHQQQCLASPFSTACFSFTSSPYPPSSAPTTPTCSPTPIS